VQRCTRERITINTFMLERSPWLTSFVEQMARINRGARSSRRRTGWANISWWTT